MMSKRICLIMSVIIKNEENVNHACFDDAENKSLDNDCRHQKGGKCECMNT